jgi:CheY-like chemotaxis protein
MADSSQMDQILLNLATNARDAMPHGGALTISTGSLHIDDEFVRIHGYGKPGIYALITVEDTGSGMNRQTREKIFEPFFTTKEVGKGTGLGLSIVYGIVKQHNGFISVYSEPGEGAIFKIFLPAIDVQPDKIRIRPPQAMVGCSAVILLAEDDLAVRSVIKTLLTEMGYNVIEAVDGQHAVEQYRQHSETIQLVLMDMIMPALNGQEAFEEIQKIKADARVLFMSGYTADYMRAKMDVAEGLRFIAKPIAPRELLKTIREIINT